MSEERQDVAKQGGAKRGLSRLRSLHSGRHRIVAEVRQIAGVARADALFGTPHVIAIVEGDDVASMDAIIDRTAELQGVRDTDSKVIRWV